MLFNVCSRYKEFVLKEDLKEKIIKCLIDIDFLPEKDIGEAAKDIRTYNKTMKHRDLEVIKEDILRWKN